jgi:hypothetical protein
MSRIAKEGKWVVHPPISSKGMLFFGYYFIFMTNLQLYRVVPHIPPPSKTSARARFRWWLVVLHHHHPTTLKTSTRARFRGWLVIFITTITTIKNEHACSFLMVVGCSSSLPPTYHHLSAPPPPKTSRYARFRGWFIILYILNTLF